MSDVYRGLPGGPLGLARVSLALVLAVGFSSMYRLIIRRQTRRSTLARLRLAVSSLSVLFGLVSLFVTHVFIITRLGFGLFAFYLPVLLSGDTIGPGGWLPAEDAALPPEPAVSPALAPRLPFMFILIMVGVGMLNTRPI